MKVYLNMRTRHGVETVDELNSADFPSYREFRTELQRLAAEYRLARMNIYRSSRCTKDWKS